MFQIQYDLKQNANGCLIGFLVKVSTGSESYLGINGKSITTIPGDIMIMDGQSVISSILKGPDSRTSINATTRQVLFTIYAPEGIPEDMIPRHMNDIEAWVRVFRMSISSSVIQITHSISKQFPGLGLKPRHPLWRDNHWFVMIK